MVIFIFGSVIWGGDLGELPRGIHWASDGYGENSGAPPPIIPFAYLYLPNLIATVALAYYSRIKNVEENAEFIEAKSELVTTDEESTSGNRWRCVFCR